MIFLEIKLEVVSFCKLRFWGILYDDSVVLKFLLEPHANYPLSSKKKTLALNKA